MSHTIAASLVVALILGALPSAIAGETADDPAGAWVAVTEPACLFHFLLEADGTGSVRRQCGLHGNPAPLERWSLRWSVDDGEIQLSLEPAAGETRMTGAGISKSGRIEVRLRWSTNQWRRAYSEGLAVHHTYSARRDGGSLTLYREASWRSALGIGPTR